MQPVEPSVRRRSIGYRELLSARRLLPPSCFRPETHAPTCRCNHECHEGCRHLHGRLRTFYQRPGREDWTAQERDVCRTCATAMTEVAEGPRAN